MISSQSLAQSPESERPAPEREEPEATTRTESRRHRSRLAVALAQVGIGLLAFVGLNLVALALLPRLMQIVNYERADWYMPTRIAQVLSAPKQDVLFMGSSRVGVGFDPELTAREVARLTGKHIEAFNLGVDGGDIALHYLLLKNMILADKTPPIIVYGLAEFELDQPAPSSFTFLSYIKTFTRPDDYTLYSGNTLNSKLDFVSRQLLPVYREHEMIADALGIAFNPKNPDHKFYARGPNHIRMTRGDFHNPGYGYSGGARAINQCRTEYGHRLAYYRIDPQRLLILGKFLDLAQKRHIRVLLINMPVTALHRSWWGNPQEIANYQAVVRTVAQQHHATLLDLYDDPEHCFPRADFIDSHHMNETGTDTITRMVADRYLAGWLASDPGAHG